MEIVVVWTESAIEELRSIYDYYFYKASEKVAKKMVNNIVDSTIKLEHAPQIGQQEKLLAHL